MGDPIGYSEQLREARAIRAESAETVRRVEEHHRLYWRKLVGELLDRVERDQREAENCLSHANRDVRIVALEVLQDVWHANDSAFRAACERLISQDPDDEVRAVAINCLSKCYEATNDQRVATMFVGFVRDDSLSTEVRMAAYFGLLVVTGEFQRRPEVILDFAFPEDVDWSVVDRVEVADVE